MQNISHFFLKLCCYILGIFIVLYVGFTIYRFVNLSLNDEYFQVGQTLPRIPHATHWDNLGKQCWNGCWGQIGFQLDRDPQEFIQDYRELLLKNNWEIIGTDESIKNRVTIKARKQIKDKNYTVEVVYDVNQSKNSQYKNSWIYINKI